MGVKSIGVERGSTRASTDFISCEFMLCAGVAFALSAPGNDSELDEGTLRASRYLRALY